MQNTLTIARRQTLGYFNGPVAYIVACLLLIALGLFFWQPFFLIGRATTRAMFEVLSAILYFATPAISMGLIAEERRSGTIELLITLPVRDWEVIVGKYLAALSLLVTILVLTLPYPFSVSTLGNLDWGTVWTGYLGVFLQGASLIAIGLMVSSWTSNQLVAFFIALGIGVFFFFIDRFLPFMSSDVATVAGFISMGEHVSSMGRGVIDTRDVFYFLSIVAFALALAFASLSSRRWR